VKRARKSRARVLAIGTLLATASPAAANPADTYGLGARGIAMGGAHTAAAADGSANYYNPANLAGLDAMVIDIGYQIADPALHIDGLDTGVNTARGLSLGVAAPGRLGPLRVALGGSAFLPDEHLTRTRTLPSDQPRFVLYDNRPQRLFLAANVAVAITPHFLVGGGIAYMSGTTGDVTLRGRVGYPVADDSDLELAVDVDLKTVRYPQAGALIRARPWLDVGLAYRGGFVLDVDLAFAIYGDVGPAGSEPVVADGFFALESIYQDLFQPEQWALGASARLAPRFQLAFDVVLHRWSRFENPATRVAIEYDLKDFNELVDIPDSPPLPAPRFHDVLVPHVGFEWQVARSLRSTWHARGGYRYEPTPTPAPSVDLNYIDGDKHTLAAGAGVTLSGLTAILPRPVSIDVFAAATWMSEVSARKVSPTDRIGDYRAGGRVLQLGASSLWRF
jgi:long-chain fatty acid transport protein